MKLEQSFEVVAPLDRVWAALVDIERVAPCLPGAEVTGRNPDGSYGGSFKVKIGPTSASYSGELQMREVDAVAHRAVMHARGSDRRGQGGAEATIVSTVADVGNGTTRIAIETDYNITGRMARFGRGGMIEEISNRLLGEFANSLQRVLGEGMESGGQPADRPAAPGTEPGTDAGRPMQVNAESEVNGRQGVEARFRAEGDAPRRTAGPDVRNPPVQGIALLGSVLWTRVRRHPVALGAIGMSLLFALWVVMRKRAAT